MKRGRKNMFNKKAFEMTISTIVVLILAVMLLLFLILFFTGAGGEFTGKIKSYFSYSNVDSVVDGCNILSNTNSEYEFCCGKKKIKYYEDGKKAEGEFSCFELLNKSFVGNRINELNCEGVKC